MMDFVQSTTNQTVGCYNMRMLRSVNYDILVYEILHMQSSNNYLRCYSLLMNNTDM